MGTAAGRRGANGDKPDRQLLSRDHDGAAGKRNPFRGGAEEHRVVHTQDCNQPPASPFVHLPDQWLTAPQLGLPLDLVNCSLTGSA
jgi:hypothetical protein